MRAMLIAILALLASSAPGATPNLDAALGRAAEAQREGAATIEENREAGEALLREAIAGYNAAIDAGLDNAALRYNLGNAWATLGDNGRALASYLLASRMDPRMQDLRVNTGVVRSRIASPVEPTPTNQAVESFSRAFGLLSLEERWWLLAVSWAIAWVAAIAPALGVRTPRGPRRIMLGMAAAVALTAGASIGAALWLERERPMAAIVEPAAGRLGPDDRAYEPAFSEPLPAGVVGRAVDARPGWARLRLRDGRDAWFPSASLEWIDPPPGAIRADLSARRSPDDAAAATRGAAPRPSL